MNKKQFKELQEAMLRNISRRLNKAGIKHQKVELVSVSLTTKDGKTFNYPPKKGRKK